MSTGILYKNIIKDGQKLNHTMVAAHHESKQNIKDANAENLTGARIGFYNMGKSEEEKWSFPQRLPLEVTHPPKRTPEPLKWYHMRME